MGEHAMARDFQAVRCPSANLPDGGGAVRRLASDRPVCVFCRMRATSAFGDSTRIRTGAVQGPHRSGGWQGLPWRGVAMVMVGVALSAVGVGCRALRDNRHTRALSMARQLSLRGAGMLQEENYEQAGPLFSEALRQSPADERAQWGMAEVLWEQGQRDDAIAHMETAVRLSGQSPELLVRLGQMYRQNGNLEASFLAAEKALQRDRQYYAAWSLKGAVLMDQQRFDDALDCYQRALIHRPDDAEARIALAELYQRLDRPQRALATLDRLADANPTSGLPAKAWMLKGQALAALGQSSEAKQCLRQAALCADDDDGELLIRLAELQSEFGELAEARVCLGRALQAGQDDPRLAGLQRKLDERFEAGDASPSTRLMPAAFAREPARQDRSEGR